METTLHYLTATGLVPSGAIYLGSLLLVAGDAAAATLTLRSGGATGTVIAVLKAPQGTIASHTFDGAAYIQTPHVTLTGAGAVCTVEG